MQLLIKFSFQIYVVFVIVSSLLIIPLTYLLLRQLKVTAVNYRGKLVIKGLGISLVLYLIDLSVIALITQNYLRNIIYLVALGSLAMGTAGLIDDFYGTPEFRGLSGHFKALLSGRLTTGIIKAFLGIAMGALISFFFSTSFLELFIKTLVFALTINFFNLLDLRPGRSLKVFIVTLVIVALTIRSPYLYYLELGLIFPAIILLAYDLREKAIIGDAGSNIIGAGAGILFIKLSTLVPSIIILAVLIALHLVAEKSSFTAIIEGNSFLRWFDNLGRLR